MASASSRSPRLFVGCTVQSADSQPTASQVLCSVFRRHHTAASALPEEQQQESSDLHSLRVPAAAEHLLLMLALVDFQNGKLFRRAPRCRRPDDASSTFRLERRDEEAATGAAQQTAQLSPSTFRKFPPVILHVSHSNSLSSSGKLLTHRRELTHDPPIPTTPIISPPLLHRQRPNAPNF